MARYREAKAELRCNLDKAYNLLSSGVIDDNTFQRQVKKIRDREDNYDYQLENLNLTISYEAMTSVEKAFNQAVAIDEATWERGRGWLGTFI